MQTQISHCPCGSGHSYQSCCGPLHSGAETAKTAEQLMRSRYSAFALKRADYLVESLHPSKHDGDELSSTQEAIQHQKWLGLTIINTEQGGAGDDQGWVEFVARFIAHGKAGELRERSRFVREAGRWFYVEGEFTRAEPTQKLRRNDPCWCGSGKKFKKCHGS